MSVDVNKQIVYYRDFEDWDKTLDLEVRLRRVGLSIINGYPTWDENKEVLGNAENCTFIYEGIDGVKDPLLRYIKVKSRDGKTYNIFNVLTNTWEKAEVPLAAASYAMDALDCYLMDNQQTWKDHTCRYAYNDAYFPQSIGISSLEPTEDGSFMVGDCDLYGWKDNNKSEKWTEYIRPRSVFKPEESDYDHWQIHSDDPILIAQNFTSSTNKIDGTYFLNNGVLDVNGVSYYVGPKAHLCLFVRQGDKVSATINGSQTQDFLCQFINISVDNGTVYGVELFGDVGTIVGIGGVNESKQNNTTILTYNKNTDEGALNAWMNDPDSDVQQPQITGSTKVTCYTGNQINISSGETDTSQMTKTNRWDDYIQSGHKTTALMSWDMFATHEARNSDGEGLKAGISSVKYNITKQNNKYTMKAEVKTNTNKVSYNIPPYVGITSASDIRNNPLAIYSGMAYKKNTVNNTDYSNWTATKAMILNNLAKFTFELQTLSFIHAQPQQIKWISNGYTIEQRSSYTTATVVATQLGYIEGLPGVISSSSNPFTLLSKENNNLTGSINYKVDGSYNKSAYCVAVLFDE